MPIGPWQMEKRPGIANLAVYFWLQKRPVTLTVVQRQCQTYFYVLVQHCCMLLELGDSGRTNA